MNLDSFGSGSGLLDLSLQADDTSLGGILDEIYTTEDEGAEPAEAGTVEEDVIMPTLKFEKAGAGYGSKVERNQRMLATGWGTSTCPGNSPPHRTCSSQ